MLDVNSHLSDEEIKKYSNRFIPKTPNVGTAKKYTNSSILLLTKIIPSIIILNIEIFK